MPAPSTPPPSQSIPEKSGGGLYLFGALVLVLGAIGLYYWKKPAPAPVVQATTATATIAQPPADVPLFAPPPPPKLEELDAGVDAGATPPKSASTGGAPGPGPCGASCTGEASSALRSALAGVAGSARGCYNRALRTSEVSGSLTVSLQIGPSGQVCSASIANDSVHSGEINSCVLGRFRNSTFPPPSGGCANVQIPINFTISNSK